jgi:hypothetical protein
MVVYEVTLDVEPQFMEALTAYMRREHIPAILATRCFRRIRFDSASPTRVRTSYQAESRPALDRYLQEFSPHYRADFQARFPQGVVATREIWTEQEAWP